MPSVTRKSQSSRSERRDEARRRLLGVVEKLLEEGESFTEISVERLVSEAGMSRSTFYVYFEDKGDLLRAWFAEITAELTDVAAGWLSLGADAAHADLRAALDRVVKTYRPHTTLMAATYDAAAYDASVRELVEAMMASNVAALRKHIKSGQSGGYVDPQLPAAQTAAWLTWMAERGLHQLVRTATTADLEKLIDAYTAIVWNTLYAPTRK
ncbi:TetR/AcrR family transcriptional regulator [Paraconexibacter antarcticus]|uniref:TetR/AcrR family transcriptional regulator n=1 Tax=Paraconexibacter antarcticus TaxID=2949664 RepID=A0ABY5DPW6_9ACTN|nr:TetR/AcrR family transcriptional regulator [Paraconexibacter antarcticus]UTI63505.1 TetR/AcrR family transcriptional regulator [Paraconexibacter antarcticus]